MWAASGFWVCYVTCWPSVKVKQSHIQAFIFSIWTPAPCPLVGMLVGGTASGINTRLHNRLRRERDLKHRARSFTDHYTQYTHIHTHSQCWNTETLQAYKDVNVHKWWFWISFFFLLINKSCLMFGKSLCTLEKKVSHSNKKFVCKIMHVVISLMRKTWNNFSLHIIFACFCIHLLLLFFCQFCIFLWKVTYLLL